MGGKFQKRKVLLNPEMQRKIDAIDKRMAPYFAAQGVREKMRAEVSVFVDTMVKKYGDGDQKRKLAHLIEQAGTGILSDVEKSLYEERQRLIRENQGR